MSIEKRVKELVPDTAEYVIGFADLTNLLKGKYSGYKLGIVIGKRLDDEIIDSILSGPTPEYLDLYNGTNQHLSELAGRISADLGSSGIPSIAINPTFSGEELDGEFARTLRSDFSHKMVATRAGIGWIGKTDLLISEKFGPRLRLATVLADCRPERTGPPIDESRCGDCRVCVESCPAQAASGALWNVHVDRDEFYNPFKCRAKCRELSWERLRQNVSLCGICVSICPLGKSDK